MIHDNSSYVLLFYFCLFSSFPNEHFDLIQLLFVVIFFSAIYNFYSCCTFKTFVMICIEVEKQIVKMRKIEFVETF